MTKKIKIPKCPKTLSGKHFWQYDIDFTVMGYPSLRCLYCEIFNDLDDTNKEEK